MTTTKQTTIQFKSQTGKNIIVTVNRVYGMEDVSYSLDGYAFVKQELKNDYTLDVEIEGVGKFQSHSLVGYVPKVKQQAIWVSGKRGSVIIPVSDEIADQINDACCERLTSDIPDYDKQEIALAKRAKENNRILPEVQLRKEWKKYNDLYNEGGEGFNPYSEYMSQERYDAIAKSYPEMFS